MNFGPIVSASIDESERLTELDDSASYYDSQSKIAVLVSKKIHLKEGIHDALTVSIQQFESEKTPYRIFVIEEKPWGLREMIVEMTTLQPAQLLIFREDKTDGLYENFEAILKMQDASPHIKVITV